MCAFQLAKKIQFLWSICLSQTNTFLITIATRISVFFEVAGKVKRAATMRSSYSLCSLRPLLFICIWVTDGCVVCVGQSPGGQRVEGRRVGGFHGQKLEANGKCKTFWGFLSFFFFHSASICCRLVLALSPTCRTSLRTLLTRTALVSVQLTMLCEGRLPLQTLAKIIVSYQQKFVAQWGRERKKNIFFGTFNNLSQPHVKNWMTQLS